LGRLNDPRRLDPLLKALQDKNSEVLSSAILALRRTSDERVVQKLVALLRHQDFGVRATAAQTIDTIRWVPTDRLQRIWFQVAKGWYERAAALGPEALDALKLVVETGPMHNAVRAVDAIGSISDPRAIQLLRAALNAKEPAVQVAATYAIGKGGGTGAVDALKACLRSEHPQVRVGSAHALGTLGASEAAGLICKMLRDKQWEVRQEAALALGKLKNLEALEPLTATLHDSDADVREAAVMALGKIADRRAIVPLVLALADEATSVRRIAAASLSRIDVDWISLPETHGAADKLKSAIKDAEPAVKFFVTQLLVNMGELPHDAIAGLASEDHLTSPAVKRTQMATHLFITLLEDPDRDVRQAAAEALGRLGGKRARQALTRTASDPDGDVAAATQMALQALEIQSQKSSEAT
jgi:HEAT repeat protein